MKGYLNIINDLYGIRRSKEEKDRFISYIKGEFDNAYIDIDKEKKHKNIVIGNIENSKVLLTAHYDTPAVSLFPNLIMPRNFILNILYQVLIALIMVILGLITSYMVCYLFVISLDFWYLIFIVFYFLFYFLMTRAFTNKHNKNDNTSGVATVLEILNKVKRDDICIVLFDNEEKGLLGSRAFSKKYKSILENKFVINFDCVGNGKNFLVACKTKATTNPLLEVLKSTVLSSEKFSVEFFDSKKIAGNTDYKNFKQAISFMAYSKNKIVGYYTSRIHTSKDMVADDENIEYLVENFNNFIEKI